MKILGDQLKYCNHLVFLDFEGTQFSHEMIAIGAVMVDLHRDKTIKRIHEGYKKFVLAKENIGKFVTELTGITQETLDKEGVHFSIMLEQLKKYIKIPLEKCKFVTFGNHDIRILNQSLAYSLSCDEKAVRTIARNHIDLSVVLGEFIRDEKNNILSLINYLKFFGVEPKGEHHDPLYDAINLAYLYQAMLDNPKKLEENYLTQLKKKSHYPYPVQQTMEKLFKGESVSPKDLEKFIKDYVEK